MKSILKILICCIILFLFIPFWYYPIYPDKIKYETVKTTCIYSFGKDENDIYDTLIKLTKRSAIEEIFGEKIKSSTIVYNGIVQKDNIQTLSTGLIRVKGNPKFFQGKSFGEVCVEINCFATDNDFKKFDPVKINKNSCIDKGNITTIKQRTKEKAKREAIVDYEPRLQLYSTKQLLPLLHNVKIIKEGFIENSSVFCTQIEAIIFPIEILTFSEYPIQSMNINQSKNYFLYENFSNIEEGLTPSDWYCGDELIVKMDKNQKVFTSSESKRRYKFTISNVKFPNNFRINFYANLGFSIYLSVVLSKNTFVFQQESTSSKTKYFINDSSEVIYEHFADQKAKFTIEKEGFVFKLYVNDIKKMVGRISNFEIPEGIIINMVNGSTSTHNFKIYKIEGEHLFIS